MAHTPEHILKEELERASDLVVVGARYAHYKHPENAYTVVAVGLMEADEKPAVVYKAESGEGIVFIRPLSSWLETVDDDGVQKPRFTRLAWN